MAVILSLVFLPRDADADDKNQEVIEEEENKEGNNETEQTYASSLTVNLPSTINIFVGEYVELLPGYFSVSPSNMTSEVKQDIKPRYNCSPFGLVLENSKLVAKEVGTYNFKISVPRSEGTTFNETILITVYAETSNAHISQTNYNLVMGESSAVNSLFNIKDNASFEVVTDNKIEYKNNKLNPLSAGSSEICFSFTQGYVKYFYHFNINIKEAPLYSIVIYNATNNIINVDISDNEMFFINYDVKNDAGWSVEQKLLVEIEDVGIVSLQDNLYPLIKFKALKTGTTTITLTSIEDINTTIDITIIIE